MRFGTQRRVAVLKRALALSALSASALLCGGALLCADALLWPELAHAQEVEEDELRDTPAWRSNVGFQLGTGIMVLLPSDGGSAGIGAQVEGRYGMALGPTVVAPGGELSLYWLSSRLIATLMPTLRVTVPLGPLAPYVRGGLGAGALSDPGEGGLAYLGGGGLMIHFTERVSLGVEVSYQAITGTDFRGLSISPMLTLGG